MGARAKDPDAPNYDPDAQSIDGPVDLDVEARPALLAKCELTRAQWMQWTKGEDPSATKVGVRGCTAAHPVDDMTWPEADRVLRRFGMALPTSALWEYACRAGTSSPYGVDRGELSKCANLADKTALATAANHQGDLDLDDGQALSAPVGWYRPIAFGLHDMVGNVLEFVQDGWARIVGKRLHTDAVVTDPADPDRMARGGSFRTLPRVARCCVRWTLRVDSHRDDFGVRPSCAIHR